MVTPDAAGAAMLNPQELAAVKNTPSFQLGSGKGKTLYVFSDPNCPSCQRIEAALEELASDYTVRIVPVAFQNGSEALAGAVMCAPGARVASSWSAGIKTGQAPGSACTEGVSKVQANNALFVKLGFTHTPTLVSESGMLAVGDARADELRQWVDRF
jgi:protein-disulfide isomerase